MIDLPFDRPGRFLRGNLHTHSTASDGRLSPEEVCEHYRLAGYDFLALTDHFLERYGFPITDTRRYRTDAFTTLLGAEPDDIAIVTSATQAIDQVAWWLRPGGGTNPEQLFAVGYAA